MRLSLFLYKRFDRRLIFIFLIPACQISFSQLPDINVDLKARNQSIDRILDDLSFQTGYFFTYNADLISEGRKINLNLLNAPLKAVLDSIFKNQDFSYRLIDKNIVIFRVNSEKPPGTEQPADNEPLRVKGVVLDGQSGKELAFATILIHGTNKGVISNLQGQFVFVYPADKQDPILVVSVIGYKNAYVHVNPENSENLIVELERDVISLQEVMIRYQNPQEILSGLREKINDNYMDERSAMTAFFREYVQKSGEIFTYSEAVIDIDKSSYTNYLAIDNARVIRGRKIQNISPEDSVILKIQSGVNNSLQLDIIKNLPDFLSAEFEEYYQYEFRNILSYQDQQVYHLGFGPLREINRPVYKGDLYINKSNLSLVAAEFEVSPEDLRKNPERFLIKKSRYIKIKPLRAIYRVEYRSTEEEKYHLSMVRAEVRFRIRKKGELLGSRYDIVLEMAVTEVEPGKRNRIPRRERLKPNSILSEQEFTYDPSFWGEYNIIEPEATIQDALKKMGIQWKDYGSQDPTH